MLVLTRTEGQEIVIGEPPMQIVVQVHELRNGKVKLCFVGPREIGIHRREVYEARKREGKSS